MDTKEALEIVKRACSTVVADLPTHQAVQKAISTLESACIDTGNIETPSTEN